MTANKRSRPSANRLSRMVLTVALLAPTALLLTGCRESEQGRPLSFEPGVYKGQKDEKISSETREELRARANKMRF